MEANVLIIGAGVAGAKAYRQLKKQPGINVTIFEAQDRAGGRIQTKTTCLGTKVEFGANFLHKVSAKQPLYKKNQQGRFDLGIVSCKLSKECGDIQLFTSEEQRQEIMKLVWKLNYVLWDEDELKPNYQDLLDHLFLPTAQKLKISDPFVLSQAKRIIARWYADGWPLIDLPTQDIEPPKGTDKELARLGGMFEKGKEEYFCYKGMDQIIDYLLQDSESNLHLNTIVSQVTQQKSGKILVRYDRNGQHEEREFDKVICTIPLGCLKKPQGATGAIQFTPNLGAAKLNAIRRMSMNNLRKIIMTFEKEAFTQAMQQETFPLIDKFLWLTEAHSAFVNSNAVIGCSAAEHPTITRWIGLDDPNPLIQAPVDDPAVREDSVSALTAVYPMLNESTLVEYSDVDWTKNIWSCGSYSYVPVASWIGDSAAFIQPEYNGALFFAGEHTTVRYEATVHGAYLSGKRAAAQVIESI